MLEGRRVLLEPASMELRFADDELLRPRIELDLANGGSVRIRVVFELPATGRFPLSSGAWFEGTPGWHVDTTEGVARPVVDSVTPAWLQRLYRSPALVHPMRDLPRVLTEFMPARRGLARRRAARSRARSPTCVDVTPQFQLRADGDIVEARAQLQRRLRRARVRRAAARAFRRRSRS